MPGPVGNESNHTFDGITVKGGIQLGESGPYFAPNETQPFGLLSPRQGGFENVPRILCSASNVSTNQRLHLNYFTAPVTKTLTSIEFTVAGTAAAATPTLIRYGIYTVSLPTYNLTLAASTTSDTALLATIDTASAAPITSPAAGYTVQAGTLYAMAFLCTSGAALPTLCGPVVARAGIQATFPLHARFLASQADLPATVTHSGTTASTNFFYWFVS